MLQDVGVDAKTGHLQPRPVSWLPSYRVIASLEFLMFLPWLRMGWKHRCASTSGSVYACKLELIHHHHD